MREHAANDQIHSRMISLRLDRPALELIDSGAQIAEPAVERSLIDRLVEAAVAGDAAAHGRLLTELYPLVLRYCRGRMRHRDSAKVSADDVAQEVCLAVVAALPSYTVTGRSFLPFVYAIAAHKVADAFRAVGRDRTVPVAALPEGPVLQAGPEQRLLVAELGERLGRLLELLTPRQREVLILRIAVGLSVAETAEAVGSTPGGVRVTQHRALSRLRALVCPPDPAVDAPDPDSPPPARSVDRSSAQRMPVSAGRP
jgi:RNA polymerase sigma-70 factor (ECF subfamily)